MRFEVDLSQTKTFESALTRAIAACSDLSPLMSDIGTYVKGRLEQGFASESDPYGKAWSPLAASTLRQKVGGSILTDKGAMRGSLTSIPSAQQVEVGVSAPYAKFHQRGTSKMPQRGMVPDKGLPPRDVQPIESLVREYMSSLFS